MERRAAAVQYANPPRAVSADARNGPLFDLRGEAGGLMGAGLYFFALPDTQMCSTLPTSEHMARIFISYSTLDKTFVRELKTWLDAKGHAAWVDEHEIHVGESVQRTIKEQIGRCDAVLFVLSPESVDSPWVQEELSLARKEEKLLIPLLLKDCDKRFPIALREIKYADFRDGRQEGWQELAQALSRHEETVQSKEPTSRLPPQKPPSRRKTSANSTPPKKGKGSFIGDTVASFIGLVMLCSLGKCVGCLWSQSPSSPSGEARTDLRQQTFTVPGGAPVASTSAPASSSDSQGSAHKADPLMDLRSQDHVRPLRDNENPRSVGQLPRGCFGFVELSALQALPSAQVLREGSDTAFEVHKTQTGEMRLIGYMETDVSENPSLPQSERLHLLLASSDVFWGFTTPVSVPWKMIQKLTPKNKKGSHPFADIRLAAELPSREASPGASPAH